MWMNIKSFMVYYKHYFIVSFIAILLAVIAKFSNDDFSRLCAVFSILLFVGVFAAYITTLSCDSYSFAKYYWRTNLTEGHVKVYFDGIFDSDYLRSKALSIVRDNLRKGEAILDIQLVLCK